MNKLDVRLPPATDADSRNRRNPSLFRPIREPVFLALQEPAAVQPAELRAAALPHDHRQRHTQHNAGTRGQERQKGHDFPRHPLFAGHPSYPQEQQVVQPQIRTLFQVHTQTSRS